MQRILRWWPGRTKAPTGGVLLSEVALGEARYANLPGLDLPSAQLELYRRLSWVYNAVTITARTAAGTPFGVKKWKGEKKEDIDNHPFEQLLRRPNPLQSRFEFLEALVGFWQLTGNAYIWLNRASESSPPNELWIIPPDKIEPVPDERLFLKGYAYDPGDGKKIPLDVWEICHIKRWHPLNTFVGLSPIEALAVVATGDMAMSRWNANFFDKDHAKPQGGLMFSDRLSDADWEKMKKDVKAEHGGTERRMMMLRGVGQGGVSWLQMGIPQKDMEFLAGRNFNKEEIYAALAPGLSSMLAVNATEANSVAGKATFDEMTIWPIHCAIAEKITQDILPAYGDGFVGEFEDVRATDRAMELQEQQSAFKVMTIKEVREKYYGLAPLGDDRDDKLVDGDKAPGDTPPQLQAFTGQQPPQEAQQEAAEQQPDTPMEAREEDDEPEENPIRADLIHWQRKAYKRAKSGQVAAVPFESEVIPVSLHAAISGALEGAQTGADVRRIFNPLINGFEVTPQHVKAAAWGTYP
jgi:HK97 family phage portal protein